MTEKASSQWKCIWYVGWVWKVEYSFDRRKCKEEYIVWRNRKWIVIPLGCLREQQIVQVGWEKGAGCDGLTEERKLEAEQERF